MQAYSFLSRKPSEQFDYPEPHKDKAESSKILTQTATEEEAAAEPFSDCFRQTSSLGETAFRKMRESQEKDE